MPFVEPQSPTLSRPFVQALVSAGQTRPGAAIIGAGFIKLFTAGPLPITPNSVVADFTDATFDGYNPFGLTTPAAIALPSGDGWGALTLANFVCTGSTVAENVAGYYLQDAGGVLVLAEYFTSPIPITTAGDFIQIDQVTPVAFTVPVT